MLIIRKLFSVGHGESEGERCDVTSYEVYLRDLLQHVDLMKKKHLNLPFYLFGHSMVSQKLLNHTCQFFEIERIPGYFVFGKNFDNHDL